MLNDYKFFYRNEFSIRDNEAVFDEPKPLRLCDDYSSKKLIAYGCGDLGAMCKEFCNFEGISIDTFIDKNSEEIKKEPKWRDEKVENINILSQFDKKNVLIIICIVNHPLKELFDIFYSRGFKNVVTFYDFAQVTKSIYPINNGWHCEFSYFSELRFKKIINTLSDKVSQAHYTSFLAWRFFRHEIEFGDAPIVKDERFFIKEVLELQINDIHFIDVGAHHGEVTDRFIQSFGGDIKKVSCFEPDSANFSVLSRNVSLPPHLGGQITFFSDILWSRAETVNFSDGFNYASCIHTSGSARKATSLDALDLEPSFLKIHTEGSELEVLKGAIKTIKKNSPVLMTTVYHNEQGVFDIFEYVMEVLPHYKHFFRLHSWAGCSAVIYSFP